MSTEKVRDADQGNRGPRDDAESVARLPKAIEDRIAYEPTTGCWLWTGALYAVGGYAQITYLGKTARAHRLIYQMLVGPIPAELETDHLCRTTCCVNPDHLELVTQLENIRRSNCPPAINARKTHCVYGHRLVEGNIYMHRGRRNCVICKLIRDQSRYRSHRVNGRLVRVVR